MTKMEYICIASFYVFRFCPMGSKGCEHISRIMGRYAAYELSPDTADYRRLIEEVANEQGIHVNSLKKTISKFIRRSWKSGYADEWKRLTGWDSNTPPNVDTAIRLLCEALPVFPELR